MRSLDFLMRTVPAAASGMCHPSAHKRVKSGFKELMFTLGIITPSSSAMSSPSSRNIFGYATSPKLFFSFVLKSRVPTDVLRCVSRRGK